MKTTIGIILMSFTFCAFASDVQVKNLKSFQHPKNKITILTAEVDLPGKGIWTIIAQKPGSAITYASLEAPVEVRAASKGKRGLASDREERGKLHQSSLRSAGRQLMKYAKDHEGRMPVLDQLDESGQRIVERALTSVAAREEDVVNLPASPHSALISDAVFEFKEPPGERKHYSRATNSIPILIELHPKKDDGKHYVLRANGTLRREIIDQNLLEKHGFEVIPLQIKLVAPEYPESALYQITAQRIRTAQAQLTATNRTTGSTVQLHFPETNGTPIADDSAWESWGRRRQSIWAHLANEHDAPGLRVWAWLQGGLLDGKWDAPEENRRRIRGRRRQGETTDIMGVLGGRAALRETLQLQALQVSDTNAIEAVPMESIDGVKVESHPFQEMLGDATVQSYAIANYVPHNRFFLGISKPEALMPLLDEGGSFLGRIGAGATGRSLRYDLKDRYFQSIGLNETFIRTLVKAKAIDELAIFSPDLFYLDGTEITTVVRMRNTAGVKLLVKLAGLEGKLGVSAFPVRTLNGNVAWWALTDQLVVIGTSQQEVQAVIELTKNDGEGSLGKSDEFRYMLTKVPFTKATRAYVYFSDPFIRDLVGPRIKIGQMRRLNEKAKMQTMAYAAMLYSHDGFPANPSLEQLVSSGYLPDSFLTTGLSYDPNGIPTSKTYGPLPKMKSIYTADLSTATAAEADSYKNYQANYSRFWRRFFDPIAMRIEEGDGELITTTYILPLLDNSLYNGAQEVIAADLKTPLRIPQIEPAPSAMLSLNLSEKVWLEFLKEILFGRNSRIETDFNVADQLGPAFHFAIYDADPVIAFGSRSLLGLGGEFGSGAERMAIPMMVSLLTRPCTMMIELKDPEPVRQFITAGRLKNIMGSMGRDTSLTTYRVGEKEFWVVGMDVWGLSLRFSFHLQDNYLLIGNMPWREPVKIVGQVDADASGASVQVLPSNAKIEQRALYLSAMEGQRQSVMEGLAYLHPLMASGIAPKKVVTQHKKMFGYAPALPSKSVLEWDGMMSECTGYGTLWAQEQPAYNAEKAFGTLQGIGKLNASMQFEETGLRTIVRWKYAKPSPAQ